MNLPQVIMYVFVFIALVGSIYGAIKTFSFFNLKRKLKEAEEFIEEIINQETYIEDNYDEKIEYYGSNEVIHIFEKHHNSSQENYFSHNKNDLLEQVDNLVEYKANKVRVIYNILPIWGLIGTFGGITLALMKMNLNVDVGYFSKSITQTLQQLTPFLDSLKLAFISSLSAIFFALVLRLFFEYTYSKISSSFSSFQAIMTYEYTPIFSATSKEDKLTKVISKFDRSLIKSFNKITKSFLDIQTSFSSSIAAQNKSNLEVINKLNEVSNSFSSSIENVNELLSSNSSKLLEFKGFINNLITLFNETRRDIHTQGEMNLDIIEKIESLNTKLDSNIENTYSDINNKFDSLNSKINTDVEKTFATISEKMNSFTEMSSKYSELIDRFDSIQNNIESNNSTAINEVRTFTQEIKTIHEGSLNIENDIKKLLINLMQKFENIETIQSDSSIIIKRTDEIIKSFEKPLEDFSKASKNIYEASNTLSNNINIKLENLFTDLRQRENLSFNKFEVDVEPFSQLTKSNSDNQRITEQLNNELNNLTNELNSFTFLRFFRKKVKSAK